MKARIVRIGNSKGIRFPKTLLQEAQLEDEVELQAEPGRILISNRHDHVQAGPMPPDA